MQIVTKCATFADLLIALERQLRRLTYPSGRTSRICPCCLTTPRLHASLNYWPSLTIG